MRDRVLRGLAILAVVQGVALLAAYSIGTASDSGWVVTGDSVDGLEVYGRSGDPTSLATGVPTLVLVFHSQCAHCERVAPEWKRWLDEHRDEVHVVSVSTEPWAEGRAYVDRHGWSVDHIRAGEGRRGSRTQAFTARTPWVFAVDARGTVLATGHGSVIDEVARPLMAPAEGLGR